MPKVTIEYTDNINKNDLKLPAMIDEMHAKFGACDTMTPERISITAYQATDYSLRNRETNNAAFTISITYLSGRTDEQQQAFANACLSTAKKYIDQITTNLNIDIKCYLTEITNNKVIKA